MNDAKRRRKLNEIAAWHDQTRATPLKRKPNKQARVVTVGQIFIVDMEQVGGDQGTEEVQASWTYDVYRHGNSDTPLAEGVAFDGSADSPHDYRRQGLGEVGAATRGMAYYNSDGDLAIYHCNEDDLVGPCEDAGDNVTEGN